MITGNNSSNWHQSRYNLFAPIPGSKSYAGINTFSGTYGVFSVPELYLLSETEHLPSDHPALERFKRLGMVVDYDEEAALISMAGLASGAPFEVCLTICPTLACNLDCPYCYQDHGRGSMTPKTQDDTIALAERMLKASGARKLMIRWYGGEPLLCPDIIEQMSIRLMALAERYGAEYKAWILTNGYLLTQDICDMLGRVRVTSAQITIDGTEKTHNATRHLTGGGGTFDRITTNLRTLRIPFKVKVRCNLHNGNEKEKDEVEKLVEELALSSGNTYIFNPVYIQTNILKSKDRDTIEPVGFEQNYQYDIDSFCSRFGPAAGRFCEANNIWQVCVNDKGRLYRCWETPDDTDDSFGSAAYWNPEDPIRTSDNPDSFTYYINSSNPLMHEQCRDCVWFPKCLALCPYTRKKYGYKCYPWKNDPDTFVLAVYKYKTGINTSEDMTNG